MKFIHNMLHDGLFTWKDNCYYSFTDVLVAVAMKIHNKVSFNIEYVSRTFFLSLQYQTISGAQLKDPGYSKIYKF